jgi:two-component system phosphate regulon response regulator PhoB
MNAPVVVAEDDPTTTRLLLLTLRSLGREIHHAADGEVALEMVRRLEPALLVLDLNLPRRSGIEVLVALRRDPQTRRLPVLILSSVSQPETQERLREAGADDFLPKPVDLKALGEHCRTLLDRPRP